jgi:sulfate adenylyltransferase subunit 2
LAEFALFTSAGQAIPGPFLFIMTPLDILENQSIFILREAYHKFRNLAMLWSMGKDSSTLLWMTRKAFFGHVPFPLIHVDTTYKIPEMIEFRDRIVREWKLQLIVGRNEEVLKAGTTFPQGKATRVECCGTLKKDALKQVLDRHHFTGVIVGVRRDEDPTRAKERYFSPRDANMEWHVDDQPPELWNQFKTDFAAGTHLRIHPLLHWTEVDVWDYIAREKIPVVPLYFSNAKGERYRSLGCAPCTASIRSPARSAAEIADELRVSKIPERSGRAQDKESEDAFEKLRRDGYM